MKKLKNLFALSLILFTLNSNFLFAQLKVVTSGDVGVGTLTPVSKFNVTGGYSTFTSTTGTITSAAFIRGNNSYSGATTPDYTWYGNDQTGFFHPTSNEIGFSTNGIERMRITQTCIYFANSATTITSSPFIRTNNAYSSAAAPDYTWYGNDQTGLFHPANNEMGFTIGGTEKMKVTGTCVYFANSATTINSAPFIRSTNSYSAETTPDYTWYNDDNTGLFHPSSGNIIGFSSDGTEIMRIHSNGNVGIGTTLPQRKFVISNAGAEGIEMNTNIGYTQIISYKRSTSTYIPLVLQDASGGNVGIGTSSPSAKLHVNGTTYLNGNVTVIGSGTYTGSWTVSDEMFKTKIENINNALEIIRKLRPKSYYLNSEKYKDFHFETVKQYGFIAQDVEKILPELVKSSVKYAEYDSIGNVINPEVTFNAINYTELIGILTQGLQELDKTLASVTENMSSVGSKQDSIIKAQNSKIDALQNQILNCCSLNIADETGTIHNNLAANNSSESIEPLLYQNVPNPFNQQTKIEYFIPSQSVSANIIIFDLSGKLLKTTPISSFGKGSIIINGNEFRPGMFIYSLIVNGKEVDTKRMILTQ